MRVDLPEEQVAFIDQLVRSGGFASSSDVLKAGLPALRDSDTSIDEWLRRGVIPVLKAMQADPGRGIPAKDVFDGIRELHAES